MIRTHPRPIAAALLVALAAALVPSAPAAAFESTVLGQPAPVKLDPNAKFDDLPLHAAAAAGDAARVWSLLAAGTDPETADAIGSTALFRRTHCDDPAVVEALLAAGADPDHRNDLGQTPLWTAATLGHTWTARVLLAAGADPGPVPEDGARRW